MKYIYLLGICMLAASCGTKPDDTQRTDTTMVHDTIYVQDDGGADKQPAGVGEAIEVERLIVPGKRIGRTRLGISAKELEQMLGRPDRADAAMGKAWLTWFGQRDGHNNITRLDIYTTYRDETMREKSVQQVHVTSPYFRTPEGLHVYSSRVEVQRAFPDIRQVKQYDSDGRDITIWDDENKGIAFDIASPQGQELCVGISIHPPGRSVTDTYIVLEP